MHTVTADLLIHYIWVPEVSLIEGQNSLWLCARGLQMGLIWLDKDNQQMLFFRMDAVDADGPRRVTLLGGCAPRQTLWILGAPFSGALPCLDRNCLAHQGFLRRV